MPCGMGRLMRWHSLGLMEECKSGKSSCAKASEDKLKSLKCTIDNVQLTIESKWKSRKAAWAPAFVKTSTYATSVDKSAGKKALADKLKVTSNAYEFN
jgi:hypothetical protein